ncbi:unnamed protein product [Mytilus coruscus]|uniref:Endonuclease/exonuclease/phosphatase domain-containing protein n=1 Tax=Mytilus coruscus TaxID=42192 RepID=A0A6J8AHR2_MYTCO|nr:unnamed protein product [Mytilus coruscus]
MSSEIFPSNYNVYRNDRGTLGGGVFVLIEKSITSVEQTSLITDGEIEWVKIKIKNNKDLLVGSFYMPHRDQKHLNELQKSLEKARTNGNTNVILAGDFNCPNIIWDTATALGPDREIQQGLVDIAETYNLTQIHTIPTREGNLLDLLFVTNPTLVKSSNNVPGISDYDIIITDLETKVHHQKSQPRKCYIYKKAKWDQISIDLKHTLEEVKEKHHQGAEVHQLWDTFKSQLQNTMNTNIPNKKIRSRNNIPWIKHKQRKMLKKKQRLYKQARKTNKWSNYRSFQKECKKQLRKAEYEYVNQNIFEGLNNNDTKPFWKSRETGSITNMRRQLEMETLEERRHSLRLILIYKVVEGLVPALPADNFVTPARPKRIIKAKEPYQITVNSSSPAVLDSVIRFSANISSLEKVLFNKTLFVYFWVNTANKNTLTSEANYTSSIDIDTFLSYAVNPGEYHMKVSVYKKEKIWPFNRHVKIGHAATKFILTEFLNGKLTIKQQLNDKMYVHNQTFATQKPLNLTSVLTDEFENDYTYAYIWFVNGTFQEWNETYSNITYNGITPGNLNITVQVKASFDFLLNKEGVFTKFITLKDEININNITGENEVCDGQHMYVNVSYNGSNPTEICWHVMHVNESFNCTWLKGNENRYTIDLPTGHEEGTYKLNITMKNDVSLAYALISFTVINGHKEEALTATSKEIQALKKQVNVIEKVVAKSLPMTGGKMVGDIDMQGHSITNLPLSITANEPVTKGWYAKNWQDLVKNFTDRVNDLEKEIKGGRSRRKLDAIAKEDKTLDSIKTTLENRLG